jgi:N-glycosylase/DNA lyase
MSHEELPAEAGTSYTVYAKVFPVRDYDLAATLTSGQAFRWRWRGESWVGVIGNHWVRLHADDFSISAACAEPISDWRWLTNYFQLDLDLSQVLMKFPDDEPMRAAVTACRGLRLLRQDPWECLASFILSSTKQIVQIQQIIGLICDRFGEPVSAGPNYGPAYAFPSPARLARCTEAELRACKMGFRAPYLLETARLLVGRQFGLARLHNLPVEIARAELMNLPGVGRKIADCVLLFAYGFQSAFPMDVWVMKALRQLYFPRRKVKMQRLHRFAAEHFGDCAGYAQQYLFHFMRTKGKSENRNLKPEITSKPEQHD